MITAPPDRQAVAALSRTGRDATRRTPFGQRDDSLRAAGPVREARDPRVLGEPPREIAPRDV